MPVRDVDAEDAVRLEQFEVKLERLLGREVVRQVVTRERIDNDDVVGFDPGGKLGLEPGAQNIITPAKELIRLTESTEKRNAKLLQP